MRDHRDCGYHSSCSGIAAGQFQEAHKACARADLDSSAAGHTETFPIEPSCSIRTFEASQPASYILLCYGETRRYKDHMALSLTLGQWLRSLQRECQTMVDAHHSHDENVWVTGSASRYSACRSAKAFVASGSHPWTTQTLFAPCNNQVRQPG